MGLSQYRGRFAPTPSGPLHLGSLVTALASFLEARHRGGVWLLRIDDLDRARCPPGTDTEILRQLEGHGLYWDEKPRYQTTCLDQYRDALVRLQALRRVYACDCTRAALKRAPPGPDDGVYPGTCRARAPRGGRAALRLRVDDVVLAYEDGWQGRQTRALASQVGDFVVQRRDGTPAYQLACAVDEQAQGITEVVRGADLLGSTFRQLWVQQQLGYVTPAYRHLPILVDGAGRKLSKQNRAPPVAVEVASQNLLQGLRFLGQRPEPDLAGARPVQILEHAARRWDPANVPRSAQVGPL